MISFLMRSYTLTGTFLISSVSAFMHSRIPPMSDTIESQNLVYASSMDFICVLRRPDVTWSSLLFVTWYSDKSRLSLFSVIPKSDVIFVVLCSIAFSASTGIFSSVTSSVASSKWRPYCTSYICPGSQSFYKYITMLYFTSLPEVKIPLQVHHHTVLDVYAQAHNSSTCSSP